jgi:hypothetical protein
MPLTKTDRLVSPYEINRVLIYAGIALFVSIGIVRATPTDATRVRARGYAVEGA